MSVSTLVCLYVSHWNVCFLCEQNDICIQHFFLLSHAVGRRPCTSCCQGRHRSLCTNQSNSWASIFNSFMKWDLKIAWQCFNSSPITMSSLSLCGIKCVDEINIHDSWACVFKFVYTSKNVPIFVNDYLRFYNINFVGFKYPTCH